MTWWLPLSDLGLIHYFIGIEVCQEKEFIIQKKYIEEMLSKFKMLGYKIVATLLVSSEKLKNEDGVKKVDAKIYMSLIDIFLYLTAIRPDIIFATSLLPRFRKNPG